MNTKKELISSLQKIKPILSRDFSVKEIAFFGSFADETNTENSDVDILVEFEKPIGWKFLSLEIYLEKMLGRKVDLVTKNSLKSQIKEDILSKLQYI